MWKILNLLLLNHAVIPPQLPTPNGWTESVRRFFEGRFEWSLRPPLTEVMDFERNSLCFIEFSLNFLDILKIVGGKKSIFFHFKHSFCSPLFCHLGCATEGGRTTPAQPHHSRPVAPLPPSCTHGENYFVMSLMDWIQVSFADTGITCNRIQCFRSPVTCSSTDSKYNWSFFNITTINIAMTFKRPTVWHVLIILKDILSRVVFKDIHC